METDQTATMQTEEKTQLPAFRLELQAPVMKNLIVGFCALNSEMELRVNGTALFIRAMDPANVSLTEIEINSYVVRTSQDGTV